MTDYSRRVSGIRAVLNIHAFTVTEGYLCMWLPSLCKPELQHQSAASSRVLRPEVLKTSCLRSAAAAAENPETRISVNLPVLAHAGHSWLKLSDLGSEWTTPLPVYLQGLHAPATETSLEDAQILSKNKLL